MSDRNPGLFLLDILDSVEMIEKYTRGLDYNEFRTNRMVVDAVVRNIEIIGEAASHIPADFKKKYKVVPWTKMKSMRNIIIHEYFGVDLKVVWGAVMKDLPGLKEDIKKIIKLEKIK